MRYVPFAIGPFACLETTSSRLRFPMPAQSSPPQIRFEPTNVSPRYGLQAIVLVPDTCNRLIRFLCIGDTEGIGPFCILARGLGQNA
jgi:hypothetical protein